MPPSVAVNRVRFFPAPKGEQAMVGGRFTGSNVSRTDGFELLAEIKEAPSAGRWSELDFDNTKVYRWLRYEGAPGSHCKIAELEFYAGERKLSGKGNAFGSIVKYAEHGWQNAFDEKTQTYAESDLPDDQVVGVDLREVATAHYPQFLPAPAAPPAVATAPTPPTEHDGPLYVIITSATPGAFILHTLGSTWPTAEHGLVYSAPIYIERTMSATPGAVIRFTLDGTWPTAEHGSVYTSPIHIEKTTTFQAVAFLDGRAATPPITATYLIKGSTKPGFSTFHWGNSLTQTTSMLSQYIRTAGYRHESRIFARPGAWTKELWNIGLTQEKERADGLWNSLDHLDHVTVQPRDFDIAEAADYDIRFFNMARQKSPGVQPWLYCEWTEMKRERPTDKGEVPSSQMKKLYPALTWEESMGAMLLYMEELQRKIAETYLEGKRPRILPTALAMGWIKNMIDHGRFPGLPPGSFYPALFNDQVHPTVTPLLNAHGNGGYLVDLTWFSAFYQESPEGKVLPIGTTFTPEQSAIVQRLAWDVIKNYPNCGLYEEGTTPAGKPEFAPAPKPIGEATPVTLSSSTPGAWFRYTLDGTPPTRTNGYVYCGVISVRPGMTVKAVAYKSGMADSPVAELNP